MDTFLQAVGLIALIVLGLAGLIFLIFRRNYKRFKLEQWAETFKIAPIRIKIRPVKKPAWQDPARVQKRVDAFHGMGFEDLGVFRLRDGPNGFFHVLFHSELEMVGGVFEEKSLGTWSDVYIAYENGSMFTVTGCRSEELPEYLPGDVKIHMEAAGETELVERAKRSREPLAAQQLGVENLALVFERAYASSIERFYLEGGLSVNLIKRKITTQDPFDPPDQKALNQLVAAWEDMAWDALREACLLHFLEETAIPAGTWRKQRDRALVIHEKMRTADLLGPTNTPMHITKPMRRLIKRHINSSAPVRDVFARLNASLPERLRYRKLAAIMQPLNADIYVAAE